MENYCTVSGNTAGDFIAMLCCVKSAHNVRAHTIKGSLRDYETLSVRTDEGTQKFIDEKRKTVLSDEALIEDICKKHNLKYNFQISTKTGLIFGRKCIITSTEYTVVLTDSDIVRLQNEHQKEQKDTLHKETEETLQLLYRNAYDAKTIEKFKQSPLFLQITKEIDVNLSQHILNQSIARDFIISVSVRNYGINVDLNSTGGYSILDKLYMFREHNFKDINNFEQENTVYCAFIEYYTKLLKSISNTKLIKITHSYGHEEYGDEHSRVSLWYNIQQSATLSDLM